MEIYPCPVIKLFGAEVQIGEIWHLGLGSFENIDKFLKNNNNFLKNTDWLEAGKYLIDIEIKANPSQVGLPITIYSLTNHNSKLLSNSED